MKTLVTVAFLTAALSVRAQSQAASQNALESEVTARLGKTSVAAAHAVKPNEMVKGGIIYSGIAVQVVKTDNPLQLINPLAPPKYGSPEDNVMRDSFTGRVFGLKIFSIRF